MRFLPLTIIFLVLVGCSGSSTPKPDDPSLPLVETDAITLWEEFGANAAAAEAKYNGKRVEVSGKLAEVRSERGRYQIILVVAEGGSRTSITGHTVTSLVGSLHGVIAVTDNSTGAARLTPGSVVKIIGTAPKVDRSSGANGYHVLFENAVVSK